MARTTMRMKMDRFRRYYDNVQTANSFVFNVHCGFKWSRSYRHEKVTRPRLSCSLLDRKAIVRITVISSIFHAVYEGLINSLFTVRWTRQFTDIMSNRMMME
ncbi:hypothetical protein AB6A40_007818 [Gnathostoma spinigerum]|uniref:Uncharacterized protein n=1 Tax=Gnathostoma spinigerum TaxID=75299 RepID=A0ABD6EV24_9BILA